MDFALDASCGNMSYVIFADQAIKPRFECKTIYEMTSELANALALSSSLPKAAPGRLDAPSV
jgi:anaerobic dimethyl sulfoxide reductase subunit A